MKEKDYSEDIEVDVNALDVEWLIHPNKVYTYTKLLADAVDIKNRTKEKLDVTYSELYLEAKGKDGTIPDIPLKKITEATIDNWIKINPRYKEANREYLEALHNTDILRGVVTAMEARKSALSNLVSLFLANYFSSPKVEDKPKIVASAERSLLEAQLEGLAEMAPIPTLPRRKKKDES